MSSIHLSRSPRDAEEPCDDAVARDWTLTPDDVTEMLHGRGDHHRLRFAIQLCWLRCSRTLRRRHTRAFRSLRSTISPASSPARAATRFVLSQPGPVGDRDATATKCSELPPFPLLRRRRRAAPATHLQERAAEGSRRTNSCQWPSNSCARLGWSRRLGPRWNVWWHRWPPMRRGRPGRITPDPPVTVQDGLEAIRRPSPRSSAIMPIVPIQEGSRRKRRRRMPADRNSLTLMNDPG
jgi:Domain of unknown function (DUF4158)